MANKENKRVPHVPSVISIFFRAEIFRRSAAVTRDDREVTCCDEDKQTEAIDRSDGIKES